jgi:hypothetical protein
MFKATKQFARENLALIAAVGIAALSACAYFNAWIDRDLGGNLFAEALGIAVTVGLIDRVLRSAERRRTRVPRFAAYNQARLILHDICSTWANMVKASIDAPPPPGADLFSKEYVDLVTSYLDLGSENQGVSSRPLWRVWLADLTSRVARQVDQVIQRYGAQMAPELTEILTGIERLPTLKLFEVLSYDARRNLPKGQIYEDDFKVVRKFHQVLVRIGEEFEDDVAYYKPFDISFNAEVEIMRTRRDIGPLIGTSRLGREFYQPNTAVSSDDLPPNAN